MSVGPIEFMGESSPQHVPASECGGADGLIQPHPHEMTASEVNAALMRTAMGPDLTMGTEILVDPATGRVIDPG